MAKICRKCIYRSEDGFCMLKNANIKNIDYEDCWFHCKMTDIKDYPYEDDYEQEEDV
jgi:hypothetical protein